jgi:hypothetical protein
LVGKFNFSFQSTKSKSKNLEGIVHTVSHCSEDDELSCLQNPTKTPIITYNFLRVLPHCPIIHWASQMCNDPRLCFCPCSKCSSPWRENNKIFIHPDHECKVGLINPQELLTHLKNKGDYTHTAICMYLEKLNTFSQGHERQDPGVNSKKRPHSEEEEKEEDEWEEEKEEVAASLDGNDVSHEHVDMNACDHSKQGLETQIASETHKDPVSEVTDRCESSKNVPDDIEKDVTDVTGPKEAKGGSEHSQNIFANENNDMNANDQSKQGQETEIGTDNPNGPESEGTDGGNVGTDVISPLESASDDKSDEPPVLPSNPPPNGKLLAFQQLLE